ncbi:AraC-like DNA-binding protein [Pseudoclavibacter chungangensis]|nr:AraC family transcriptional regulator [Pseudoclavibacter chungangensis]NYJ67302.1 AraC-like DNA-binding protein [Pseudoclavibacter chungangensis]
MASWRSATPAPAAGAAEIAGNVLHPSDFLSHVALARRAPDARLAPWVRHYWFVAWDLPPGVGHRPRVLPALGTSLTVEYGRVRRTGTNGPGAFATGPVTRATFDIGLTGRGGTAGILLHPGVASTVFGLAARELTDAVLSLERTSERERSGGAREIPTELVTEQRAFASDADRTAARFDEALLSVDWPDPGPSTLVAELVERIEHDPDATSVARVEGVTGYSTRTVQRLFARDLGVGVGWVLRRRRLRDAVRRLDLGHEGSLTELAAECGWYDHSHFTREFRELIGVTPSAYRRARRLP